MNAQLMFLAQSSTGAIFEIMALLLVAGIIGFVIAWLFQKSIADNTLIEFNAEKKKLDDHLEKLKTEKARLNENLVEKDKEFRRMALEINALINALKGMSREPDPEAKIKTDNFIDYSSFEPQQRKKKMT